MLYIRSLLQNRNSFRVQLFSIGVGRIKRLIRTVRHEECSLKRSLKSLPKDEFPDWSKFKAFADVKNKISFIFEWVENIVGKGENDGHQHFLLFPQCSERDCFSGVDSSRFCVVKGIRQISGDGIHRCRYRIGRVVTSVIKGAFAKNIDTCRLARTAQA